jgi:hypothetical protein
MKKIMLIIASMILSVSVYGNGNEPPEAQCQDVTVEAGDGCEADASIDAGSFDPDGGAITFTQSPEGPYPLGATLVTLTVTDDFGNTDSCTGSVEVVDTTPPEVFCQNVRVLAGANGTAEASIDDGSYDACDVTLAQNPPGPYGVGVHLVTLTVTDSSGNQDSCQAYVEVEAPVAIDIKPTSCPNPLNIKSKGVLPVAILGTADFDVTTVDVASLRLVGVSPIRSRLKDVATPVAAAVDVCDCTTEGPDGYLDLALKFNAQEIIEALGDINNGDVLQLGLTGVLSDGTPFEGWDCVIVISRSRSN